MELDLSDCKKLEPTDFCNLNGKISISLLINIFFSFIKIFKIQQKGLKFLTKLDASKTKMNDLAIKEMKLPNLRHLYLTDTNITDLGISLLPSKNIICKNPIT